MWEISRGVVVGKSPNSLSHWGRGVTPKSKSRCAAPHADYFLFGEAKESD